MKKILIAVISLLLISIFNTPQVFAEPNSPPAVLMRIEPNIANVGEPVKITLVGNSLGNVLRKVEAHIVVEGSAVPVSGFKHYIDEGNNAQQLQLQKAEETGSKGNKRFYVWLNTNQQDGVNWGSEAVPLYHIEFTPQEEGFIQTYLTIDTNLAYGNQTSNNFTNYTTLNNPRRVTVIGTNPEVTPAPTTVSSPTPQPTPDYNQEFENLREEVNTLRNQVQTQETRLSFVERILRDIQRALSRLFSF